MTQSSSSLLRSSPERRARAQTTQGPRAEARAVVTRRVPAVSRAIAILRLLGHSEAPQGVHAIANALGLVPSTCLHILRVLVTEELASFDSETKRYALAAGVLSIAGGMLRRRSFSDVAQPVLDDLSRRWSATAIAVESSGLEHIFVSAISRTEQALRIRVDIGSRFPALISATGRCLAAFGDHPAKELDRRFRALRWDNPPTLRGWRAEVEVTRASGYAIDDGRYISGVTIVAAPVFSLRRPKYALAIVGIAEQLRKIGYESIGKALRTESEALSRRLEDGGG